MIHFLRDMTSLSSYIIGIFLRDHTGPIGTAPYPMISPDKRGRCVSLPRLAAAEQAAANA
jgi:hypothetical protein